jgi:osmotically-inducible protein OsmY
MGEYEDRYPDAYGRDEIEQEETHLDHRGNELPASLDAATAVNIQEPAAPLAARLRARPVERPRRLLVERTPREIYDEVAAQLRASPFIDSSGIGVAVDGTEVTLTGTINSLIAISLAQALASNVPGVSRAQVQLRVQPASRPSPA